ncbi:hypothetical protein CEXT_47701 [Caerostris extrusa]|uniref:Uncharacterized protein n=1 Tax=Caerostris extrusa TaxID=172846 RepID=A0AAV4W2T2_CAEEX|nr:hypothetical protein CEXT_47701 [Caerostris extrusa]
MGESGLGEMECLECIHVIYWVGINPRKGKHASYSRNAASNAPEESAVCSQRLQNSRLNYEVWYKICPTGGNCCGKWNAWNVSTSSVWSGSIHGKVNMPAIPGMLHPMHLRDCWFDWQ